MKKRRNTEPIEDATPLPRVRQEARNWAAAGAKLEGKNTAGMMMQEVPARAISNQTGTRYYTEKEPMMFESRAKPNRGRTKGMVKSAASSTSSNRKVSKVVNIPQNPKDTEVYWGGIKRTPRGQAMQDAQQWANTANNMSAANAKQGPLVVTMQPSSLDSKGPNKGKILARPTSAKNVGSKGSTSQKMAKGQGAFINGKPASADLTKAMRPRKKG